MAMLKKFITSIKKLFKSKKRSNKKKKKVRPKTRRVIHRKRTKISARQKVKKTSKSQTVKRQSAILKQLPIFSKAKKPSVKISQHLSSQKDILAGTITHFFPRIQVVVLKIAQGNIRVGDRIHIRGTSTNFKQKVSSMQIESVDVTVAKKGQLIGLKTDKIAKTGDKVYKIE